MGPDDKTVLLQAEHERPVAQPERAEDAEHGGHRALADGRGPDRGQEQAQGRGGQDDRQYDIQPVHSARPVRIR